MRRRIEIALAFILLVRMKFAAPTIPDGMIMIMRLKYQEVVALAPDKLHLTSGLKAKG